ncbi:hypothetical protein NQ317_001983 [Molorchus minor]|uniref:Carboxylic ester hydrolase n=1 Tax=Molorchus minor TaxID=1323400 RepID=A0ABQ9JHK8_9CUCU|nr:hypothetical protein NQ317_001983 [Molorchus minor]
MSFEFNGLKSSEEVIVSLPKGPIRGRVEVTYSNVTFYAFQQVPYAMPPLGKLRFMAPQPVSAWSDVLDCTVETKICRQTSRHGKLENDDCLYLNIYTPAEPGSNNSLSVMFYIYGGGFVRGSATFGLVGPHFFMEQGVVIVTVNYRTGPQGFLSTGDGVIPGNMGLKDQNLALKWVQENIHLFGGDPDKVTIFGQSAGAASVTYQILSPQSKGLFRAAIAQSGSALSPWAYQRHAKDIAYQLAAQFDPTFNRNRTSLELLELLQSVPEENITAVAESLHPEGVSTENIIQGFYYAPVIEIEHKGAFLTEYQYTLVESGNFTKVPLVIGICSEESLSRAANLTAFKEVVENYESNIKNLVNEDMHITDSETLASVGEEIRKIYADDQLAANLSNAVRFYSDTSFNRGVIRYAELQSQYTDVYFYQFTYYGEMMGMHLPNLLGAGRVSHAGDLRYEWALNNESNVHIYDDDDVRTQQRYIKLFTDFSKHLNPTPEQSSLMQNLIWPKVTSENFYYLDIDTNLTIRTNPKGESYSKWTDIYDKWGVRPFDTKRICGDSESRDRISHSALLMFFDKLGFQDKCVILHSDSDDIPSDIEDAARNANSEELVINIKNGKIKGRTEVTYSNVTFYAFQQIPYAKPPVEKLRFMAPQPAEAWDDILDCTVDTKICRQMKQNSTMESEDCLYCKCVHTSETRN